MICPKCSSTTRVTHTKDGGEVIRRRRCTSCGHKFKTRERSEDAQLGVDAKARRAFAEAKQIIDALEPSKSDTSSKIHPRK